MKTFKVTCNLCLCTEIIEAKSIEALADTLRKETGCWTGKHIYNRNKLEDSKIEEIKERNL